MVSSSLVTSSMRITYCVCMLWIYSADLTVFTYLSARVQIWSFLRLFSRWPNRGRSQPQSLPGKWGLSSSCPKPSLPREQFAYSGIWFEKAFCIQVMLAPAIGYTDIVPSESRNVIKHAYLHLSYSGGQNIPIIFWSWHTSFSSSPVVIITLF